MCVGAMHHQSTFSCSVPLRECLLKWFVSQFLRLIQLFRSGQLCDSCLQCADSGLKAGEMFGEGERVVIIAMHDDLYVLLYAIDSFGVDAAK